jgi:hypothetical protein
MPERNPHELADRFEQEADRLQQESDRVGHEVASAREDWERKRADPSIPGAAPEEVPEGERQPESPAPQAPSAADTDDDPEDDPA